MAKVDMIKGDQTASYWSRRRGSSLSDMSVHMDDAGVAVVIVTSSAVEAVDGDERCEPIDAVNV